MLCKYLLSFTFIFVTCIFGILRREQAYIKTVLRKYGCVKIHIIIVYLDSLFSDLVSAFSWSSSFCNCVTIFAFVFHKYCSNLSTDSKFLNPLKDGGLRSFKTISASKLEEKKSIPTAILQQYSTNKWFFINKFSWTKILFARKWS